MSWPAFWSTGETVTETRLNGWMNSILTWGGVVDTGGNAIKVPSTVPSDANIPNNGIAIYLDEGANLIKFRVRYSTGVLKTGTMSLT